MYSPVNIKSGTVYFDDVFVLAMTGNVALNQSTKQSSDWADRSGIRYVSSFAVDGRRGHKLSITPCTRTNDTRQPAHWTVTLDAQYNVYRFKIYNRNQTGCGGQCKFAFSIIKKE